MGLGDFRCACESTVSFILFPGLSATSSECLPRLTLTSCRLDDDALLRAWERRDEMRRDAEIWASRLSSGPSDDMPLSALTRVLI